jgi:hypothetical protein
LKRGSLYRRSPFRIGLGTFLVLCGVVGSSIGLYVRSHPTKDPDSYVEEWLLDGFRIDIVWLYGPNRDQKGEFVYLVAHPTGFEGRRWNLAPRGIFIDVRPLIEMPRGTNRTAGKLDCKYWLFTSSLDPGVRPIEGPFAPIIPSDYDAFKKSSLWNDYMRPALIEESQRYDRWWFEQYGTRYPHSRFTSDETWEKWLAEKRPEASPGGPTAIQR